MATFAICASRAPRLDGYNAKNFQVLWDITKLDVMNLVGNFFRHNLLDPKVNMTNIVLISKKQNAIHIADYLPISLCNVTYKIIAKILVGRLRPLLPKFIFEH